MQILEQLQKEHPGPDPVVPMYTVAPCVWGREMGASTSGPLWQHKIDEESLLKRLTGEK